MNSDIEARSRTITRERDDLRTRLNTLNSQYRSVTEERDGIKSILKNPEWVIFKGSAYYVSKTEKNWHESRRYCRSVGADLMVINSNDKQSFANGFNKYMWIGLTDLETEGTWKWVDGTTLTSGYFNDGEPNGNTNENCGNIKRYGDLKSWNDETCSKSLNWICEKKLA
ncbi:hypothetical protein ILYODFUR_026015 [Ilyodon furcidens]|uniref:C-type lectin domain-containing protein n=1 Tax=Ilyodon furcidens TaxID=33524 RepID=A0ABV0V8A2_9TELE